MDNKKKIRNLYNKYRKYYISNTEKSPKLYADYRFRKEEICFYGIVYSCLIAFLAFVFYRSILSAILLSPLLFLFLAKKKEILSIQQKKTLLLEFQETILVVSSNLKAGYAIENAFCEAYKDIVMLYGKDSMMAEELERLQSGIQNNIVLEELLLDFAKRSDLEDVKDFVDIFCIAKRNGGNLNGIIQNTVVTISEKIAVSREIDTMIHARQFEQKIMNVIPFGIIFYISLTSPGFFQVLYHNLKGNFVMTICLLIYGAAYLLSEKITRIEV